MAEGQFTSIPSIPFVVNHHQKIVPQAKNFLPGAFERARTLRLPDGCHLEIRVELLFRKINTLGAVTLKKDILFPKTLLKKMLYIGANRLTIRYPNQRLMI